MAQQSDITLAQIASVSTFYSQFRHRPVGRNLISVCNGTACHVKGAERVYDVLRDYLHITGKHDTDSSGEYTVEKVFCIGCCTLAPVVRCGDDVYGPQTTDGIPQLIRRIEALPGPGPTARSSPARSAAASLRARSRSASIPAVWPGVATAPSAPWSTPSADSDVPVRIKRVACGLMCDQAPTIEIEVPGQPPKVYANVTETAAEALVTRHFRPRRVATRLRSFLGHALDRLLDDTPQIPPQTHAVDVPGRRMWRPSSGRRSISPPNISAAAIPWISTNTLPAAASRRWPVAWKKCSLRKWSRKSARAGCGDGAVPVFPRA